MVPYCVKFGQKTYGNLKLRSVKFEVYIMLHDIAYTIMPKKNNLNDLWSINYGKLSKHLS